MSKRASLAADLAEVIISEDYRSACNTACDNATTDEVYVDTKDLLYNAIVDAYDSKLGKDKKRRRPWEIRRLFALSAMEADDSVDTRLFGQYVTGLGGLSIANDLTAEDLPSGNIGPKKTNDMIKSGNRLSIDPAEFLEDTLRTIAVRRESNPANIGPENYCTGLKYFIDKIPEDSLDAITADESVMENVHLLLAGYFVVTEKDKPNFIELTNLLYAIRSLPEGTINESQAGQLIKQLLEELPNLNRASLNIVIAALPKMNLSKFGEQAAVLLDLAIRQRGELERSGELLGALSTIRRMPAGHATVSAFNALFELSSNIEQESLDIFDLDFMNDCIFAITTANDTDPELAIRAKDIAFNVAQRAVKLLHSKKGRATQEAFDELKTIVQRTADNYKKI